MQFLNFLQSTLFISTLLLVLTTIFFLYTIYKGYRYTNTLSKKVYSMGQGITNEKVEDLISYLDTRYIPFYAANFVKAGYRIVDMEKRLDDDLKQRLKIMALSKGIVVD